jgi:hypothetical protein
MKTGHEQRIEIVTGVDTDRAPMFCATPRTSAAMIRGEDTLWKDTLWAWLDVFEG